MKKRTFLWAALLVCGCLAACQSDKDTNEVPAPKPDDETPVTPPTPVEPTTPQPGTYTFVLPDFAAKTAWEAGDEISLRGNYTPDVITVTLAAEDISADGKTATVEVTALPKTFCSPDYLYAAYPAGVIDFDSTFCDATVRFLSEDLALVAYWVEGNTFQFKAINGAVRFAVSGDYDGIVVGTPKRDDIRFERLTAEYSSTKELTVTRPRDLAHPFYTLEMPADGQCFLLMPGGLKITNGLNIYLRKGDSYPKYYSYAQALTIQAGEVIDLGDISGSLADYEGAAPEEMDMPVITKRTEYKVNVEELSGICLTEDGESLWAVGDEGQLAIVTIKDEKVSVQNVKHFGNDLEAVTRDPATNTLYFGTEPNSVYRCSDPFTSYTRIFKVEKASNYGNSGIEGISWYKDNTLYVGTQVGANLWRFDLEGNELDFISLKTVRAAVQEIGGLCYDPVNDWLWVTDSEAHSLFVFSGDARTYYGYYKLSSSYNNESVCVDHAHNCVWVGDDNDSQPRIIRLDMDNLTRPVSAE